MTTISFIPKTTVADPAPKTVVSDTATDAAATTIEAEGEQAGNFIEDFNALLDGTSETETSSEPTNALDWIKEMMTGTDGVDGSTPSSTDFANLTIPTIQELVARFPGNIVEIKQQLLTLRDKLIDATNKAKSDLNSTSMSTYQSHALSLHINDLEKNLQRIETNLSAIPGLLKSQKASNEAEMTKLTEYLKAKWEYDNGITEECPPPNMWDLNGDNRVGDTSIVLGVLKNEDGEVVREAPINEDTMVEVLGTKTGMPIGCAESFVGIDKVLCNDNLEWLAPTEDADINTVVSKDIDFDNPDVLANFGVKVGEYIYAKYDTEFDEFVVDEKDFGLQIAPTRLDANGSIVQDAPDPDAYVDENITYRAIRITELNVSTVRPENFPDPYDKNVHGGDIQLKAKDKDGRVIFTWKIRGRSVDDFSHSNINDLAAGTWNKDHTEKATININSSPYVCASSFSLAILDTDTGAELDNRETPMVLNAGNYISTAKARMSRETLKALLMEHGHYSDTEANDLIDGTGKDDGKAAYTLRRFLNEEAADEASLKDDTQKNPVGTLGAKDDNHEYASTMNTIGIIVKGQNSFKGTAFNDLVISTEPSFSMYEQDNEGKINPLANRYADMGNGFNAYIAAGGNNYVRGATFARIWEGKKPDPYGGQIAEISNPAQMSFYNNYSEENTDGETTFKKDEIKTNPRCFVDVDLNDGTVNIGNPYETYKEDGHTPDNSGKADDMYGANKQQELESADDFPKNDYYEIDGATDTTFVNPEDSDKGSISATQWGNTEYQNSGTAEKKELEEAIREPEKLQVELLGGQGWIQSPFLQQMRSEMDSVFSGWVNELGYESAGMEGIDIETGEGVPTTDEDYNSEE